MSANYFVPSDYHLKYLASLKPEMAYKKGEKVISWQRILRARLKKLLGDFPKKKHPLRPKILERKEFRDYFREKLVFISKPFADVPAYLLIPKNASLPAPAVICLQGHSPGMYISIGEARSKSDRELIA